MTGRTLSIRALVLGFVWLGASGFESCHNLTAPQGSPSTPLLEFRFDSTLKHTGRGSSLSLPITVDSLSPLEAMVDFQSASQPAGLGVRVEPARLVASRTATLIVDVPSGAALGTYTITVTGRLVINNVPHVDLTTRTGSVEVVSNEGNFSILCDPAEFTLFAAQTRAVSCRAIRDGFGLPIDLSFEPVPAYLGVTPSSFRLEGGAPVEFRVGRGGSEIPPPSEYTLRFIGRATAPGVGFFERQFALRILLPRL